ncbi:MAG: hydroxymethylglutaryl-CoA reductase, degradative [Spirochaetaceae bacterium]|nr:hydroxymethylglutaryl-CoA reductase, degradative [Spirochaetaceae bacterium]
MRLSRNFRKLSINKRREQIQTTFDLSLSIDELENSQKILETADAMIENAAGVFSVPLGFVPELIVNNKSYTIPMATEEPSVIAAASFVSTIINRHSGVSAFGAPAIMSEQIFLTRYNSNTVSEIQELEEEIFSLSHNLLASMEKRGGGLEKVQATAINDSILKVELFVNVCDAMGANILNTLGELLGPWLAEKTKTSLLMAILSNSGESRISTAEFSIPLEDLGRNGKTGSEITQRILQASEVAQLDPERAVTHNKGIMNGVLALVLATGNDTRAVESAVHYHASIKGKYTALSNYTLKNGILTGKIELPIPVALVGGAVQFHQTAVNNLKILGVTSVSELSAVTAALGLVQNFAALFALVSEGIQKGHMKLHEKKKLNES